MAYDFDLFVIGAGSGGVRAARMSAGFGAKVAICEDRYMGGTCVNVGCVPKKLYVYAAEYSKQVKNSQGFGWSTPSPSFDWAVLRDNKKDEIKRLNGIYENLLTNANVTLLDGRGKILGAHQVEVNGVSYSCERILIAVGGLPYVPDFPGREHVVSSDQVFDLASFPKDILIVGGGYIAVEFAHVFAGLGVDVCLVYRGETVLRGFDEDVRIAVHEGLEDAGVRVITHAVFARIDKAANGLCVELGSGQGLETGADGLDGQ